MQEEENEQEQKTEGGFYKGLGKLAIGLFAVQLVVGILRAVGASLASSINIRNRNF